MSKETSKDNKKEASKTIAIPEILTMIRQPNSVTNARYDYSLTQQRVFIAVIRELQSIITQYNNKSVPFSQLSLFKENKENVRFVLPLKEICKDKSYYSEAIDAVEKIANIPFRFATKNPTTGEDSLRVGGLFTAYVPNKYDRSITIEMPKDVAKQLIMLEYGYTSFAYEIAFNAKNKYTIRIYQLISRWKDRGGLKVSLKEFREWLSLGDKYEDFAQLKRRVIDPAHAELHQKADCWFEVDKVEREGKAVKFLHFKIITLNEVGRFNKLKDDNYQLLKMHFAFTDKHFEKIRPILDSIYNVDRLRAKILELGQFVKQTDTHIGDIASYAVKAIINEFKKGK
jgi:plasmid replication initiation protein